MHTWMNEWMHHEFIHNRKKIELRSPESPPRHSVQSFADGNLLLSKLWLLWCTYSNTILSQCPITLITISYDWYKPFSLKFSLLICCPGLRAADKRQRPVSEALWILGLHLKNLLAWQITLPQLSHLLDDGFGLDDLGVSFQLWNLVEVKGIICQLWPSETHSTCLNSYGLLLNDPLFSLVLAGMVLILILSFHFQTLFEYHFNSCCKFPYIYVTVLRMSL